MTITFRQGFLGGASFALVLGIYLAWLWQPDHQVELHTDHLLQEIEKHDWSGIAELIAQGYRDDWGNDRERLLARLREVLSFTRNMKIRAVAPDVSSQGRDAKWMARVQVNGDDNDVMSEIKQRVNSLSVPFELHWQRQSAKPWDWKLVGVANRELKIESAPY